MAITLVGGDGDYGAAPTGNKTSQTSTTINLSTTITALVDDVVVMTIAADNAGTSGVSSFSSIGAPSTGAVTWETAQVVNRTSGSAIDGATLIMLVGKVTSQISTSSTVAVSWSPATTAKGWRILLIRGADSTIQTFASSTGTGTTPSVASGSTPVHAVQSGDIVIGSVATESGTLPTGDGDATNGSWSSILTGGGTGTGGDATKMAVGVQNKIVDADGTQTFDPGTANTDYAVAILGLSVPVAVEERVPYYRPMTQLLAH